ncbi:hypothetical protein CEXT_806491 [Caerostris extrusa]|uniref:Uncharacterized protein n=1 Tax=Caerostris extrusa TaxID=172846 RepID=A0AAV4UCG4_CAEEX|nr:hypothetical protein CEXT_806491 [Caerostris extrusa]
MCFEWKQPNSRASFSPNPKMKATSGTDCRHQITKCSEEPPSSRQILKNISQMFYIFAVLSAINQEMIYSGVILSSRNTLLIKEWGKRISRNNMMNTTLCALNGNNPIQEPVSHQTQK